MSTGTVMTTIPHKRSSIKTAGLPQSMTAHALQIPAGTPANCSSSTELQSSPCLDQSPAESGVLCVCSPRTCMLFHQPQALSRSGL